MPSEFEPVIYGSGKHLSAIDYFFRPFAERGTSTRLPAPSIAPHRARLIAPGGARLPLANTDWDYK